MYGPLKLTLQYLRYYFFASNRKGHGMHSPFVFDFIRHVMNDETVYPGYEKVEGLRRHLLQDQTILEIEDLGAGSSHRVTNSRTIASIAAKAAKPKKFGQLLFRIARYYKAKNILELGTSLGISSGYLASGNENSQLVTIEGSPQVVNAARKNIESLKLTNISILHGNFDDLVPQVLEKMGLLDLCFIDGNHRKEPTLRYFEWLLSRVNNDSILIFDDIHWSPEMEEAWTAIKKNRRVKCTIDLFFIGIVFFRQEFREKRDFIIRF
jgi:predicted O-methyltransferase YrrM